MELVALANRPGANRSELAERFGVSRKTLYKWLARRCAGQTPAESMATAMRDRSRRPRTSPGRTDAAMEQRVLEVRAAHPAWGGRKIRAVLLRRHDEAPAASTITQVLRRHDRLDAQACDAVKAYQRFEHPSPNDLWQCDFKGDFAMGDGSRCHTLAMLDDHSRYALHLSACVNQQRQTVWTRLLETFGRYGLPRRMLMDNGSPWGVGHDPGCYTQLEVDLLCLDVRVVHGRPYHPQTQGKQERFNRTLEVELLQGRCIDDHAHAQRLFDPFRTMYNHERPHEALDQQPPISRYRPSPRSLPKRIDEPVYYDNDVVRRLNRVGQLSFQCRVYKLSEAFGHRSVAVRPTTTDGLWSVHFGCHRIALTDLRDGSSRMVRE